MVEDAVNFIHANYSKRVTIAELCQVAHMGRTRFFAAFKAETKKKPQEYIKDLRLVKAFQLLQSHKIYVATAAYRVGYSSTSQFSRDFKKKFGMLPSSVILEPEKEVCE